MAQQPRLGTILGEHGETISRPADSLADLNLPPGVQALVETRVNAAVEQLREDNRREIKDLVRKNTRKWQVIAAISVLFTLGSWFIAPQQIRKWAKDYVQKRMTAPELKKAADQAIATQMSDYVRAQIDPVKKDISAKQEQLQSAQSTINDQVRVQQLAIGAKAGGLADYEELQRDAARTDELGNTAKTSLKEVELYFDADRAQLTFPTFADTVSSQDPGWSYEEMIVYLRDEDPKQREGAVNTISRLDGYEKSKGIVEELISQLERERDLRVIARISRALALITKEEFKPLDKTGILNWWTIHKSDQQYKSPYLGFKKAWPFLMKTDNTKDIPSMISALDETLAVDPDAVYTRVLKGRCLTLSGKLDDAEKEFVEAEKRQPNFRWLLLWRSSVLFKRGKSDDAVASMNACFVRSPALAAFAKTLPDYTELLRNPKIVWPKKK